MSDPLNSYLQAMVTCRSNLGAKTPDGFAFECFEDLVLQRGELFTSKDLTAEQRAFITPAIGRRDYRMRECYYNAQTVVMRANSDRVKYAEGFALGNAMMPVLHGWIMLDGAVIDLTWRTNEKRERGRLGDRIFGRIPAGWLYRGLVFDRSTVNERLARTGAASSFIDDYENRWPLLRK